MVEQNPDGLGGSPERSGAYPSFEPPNPSDPAAARYGPPAAPSRPAPRTPSTQPAPPAHTAPPFGSPPGGAPGPSTGYRYPAPPPTRPSRAPEQPRPETGPRSGGRSATGDERRPLIIGGVVGLALLLVVLGFFFARDAIAPRPAPEPPTPVTATPAPTRTITVRPSPRPTASPTPRITIDGSLAELPDQVGPWRLAGPRGPFGIYAGDSTDGSIELMWISDLTSIAEWGRTLDDPVLSPDSRTVCGTFGGDPTCYVQTRSGVYQAWSGDGVSVAGLTEFSEEFARLVA